MNESNRRLKIIVLEIKIKETKLFGRQHSFVNYRPRGEACKIKLLGETANFPSDKLFCPTPNDKQFSFKCCLVFRVLAFPNEYLPDKWLRVLCDRAEQFVADGNVAPAEERLTFLGNDPFQNSFAKIAVVFVCRQENRSNGVKTGIRQSNMQFFTL